MLRLSFKLDFILIFLGIVFIPNYQVFSQNLQVGIPIIEENLRTNQLEGKTNLAISFLQRPLEVGDFKAKWEELVNSDSLNLLMSPHGKGVNNKNVDFGIMPIYVNTGFDGGRPYPSTSNLLMNKGFQTYLTSGAFFSYGSLSVQIQPEMIYAQNLGYDTGTSKSWNTEFIERFGEKSYFRVFPGQSSVRFNFGAFSFGASTENIWWGPGQYNSLLFSNNAFGFPHFTLNTRRPAKTLLGTFEGQLIVGKLQGSGLSNTTVENLIDDWRYLNGISFSYQPKWVNGLFFGVSRVFQQYESFMGNSFSDYFPIFEAFQKKDKFENGNDSGKFDEEGRDQQVTFFGRYVIPKAKAEIYFEYGRRDHAYDWREAILNPEHARAFIAGFNKLIPLRNKSRILFRSEIIQQQESINILVRYPGTGGSLNWSGHGVVRHGFTNFGQMMGPGIGPSSNAQTVELAWLKHINKFGIKLERLNRHQDYYTTNFNDPSEPGRWVDFNAGILGNFKLNNVLISSQFSLINSHNYQWGLSSESTAYFSKGERVFSFQSQIALIYLFKN